VFWPGHIVQRELNFCLNFRELLGCSNNWGGGRGDLGHLSGTVPMPHPHTCPHALTQCQLSVVHSMQGQDRGAAEGRFSAAAV